MLDWPVGVKSREISRKSPCPPTGPTRFSGSARAHRRSQEPACRAKLVRCDTNAPRTHAP
eukprot:scaffold60004_cov64-Phaeocystis_antarctica.AAC.5